MTPVSEGLVLPIDAKRSVAVAAPRSGRGRTRKRDDAVNPEKKPAVSGPRFFTPEEASKRVVKFADSAGEVRTYDIDSDAKFYRLVRAVRSTLPAVHRSADDQADAEAHAVAKAAALEELTTGATNARYAASWTLKEAKIYVAPEAERAFAEDDVLRLVVPVVLTRRRAIAALADDWQLVHHYGAMPDKAEIEKHRSARAYVQFGREDFRVARARSVVEPTTADALRPTDLESSGTGEAEQADVRRPPTRSKSPRAATAKRSSSCVHDPVDPRPDVQSWLMDSGCPLDLIDATDARSCTDFIVQGEAVTLATANGDTTSKKVLPLRIGKLGETIRP